MTNDWDSLPYFQSDWEGKIKFYKSTEFENIKRTILNSDADTFPKKENVFRALELTQLNRVRVVIVGQDPYHGEGEANGLAFSVNSGVKIPPSLKNIFAELRYDLAEVRRNSDLSDWATQGVLLLNTVLTVEKDKPSSHKNIGWEFFTQTIIEIINVERDNIVFILWGSHAQKFEKLIDAQKHCIIKSAHPSPLSSYRGFFGSRPFSKCNDYLTSKQKEAIVWA